jgi:PTH1 family peptidyl-tRNA hydrolase
MEGAWVAVGLGNPGRRYEKTRHNAGARALTILTKQLGTKLKRSKTQALVGEAMTDGERLLLARPATFMNESGPAVAQVLRWFRLRPDRMIVVYDEIDLRANTLRIKRGGGTAGHNGLDSIMRAVGTPDFYRVRIGVGRPPGRQDPADWVLHPMSRKEGRELAETEEMAADAVLSIIHDGIERAMNRFNTRS